jgi:hypothetical protein
VKRLLIPAAALLGLVFAVPAANADSVSVRIGSPGYHHGYHHHGWRHHARGHCRTVVKKRWHHGRRVVTRKRVCW